MQSGERCRFFFNVFNSSKVALLRSSLGTDRFTKQDLNALILQKWFYYGFGLVPSASQSKVGTVTKIWGGLATERFIFLLYQIFWGRDAIFRCIFLRLVFDDGLSMGCQKMKEKGKNIKKRCGEKGNKNLLLVDWLQSTKGSQPNERMKGEK